MEVRKIITISIIIFVIYFVLDFVFSNVMLYIMSGIIGGTISTVFKAIGIKAGTILIGLVWTLLLAGVVFLLYRSNNTVLKYLLVIITGMLLYVIDMFVGSIPYSDTVNTENITTVNNIIIGFLVLIKSAVLSFIIYTSIIKS